ncbi:hypothetical protein D018_4148A, partial [Vibrio parahaemolyticus VP2007-007]
MGQDWEDIS